MVTQNLTDLDKELLVLRLEGEREPVDDGAEDLEEFADAIEVLSLVDEPGGHKHFSARDFQIHFL